jgi:hypothetical protein
MPPGTKATLDAQSAVFFRLEEVAFPFASSLEIENGKQPGATVRILARTTEKAYRLTDGPVDLSRFHNWTPTGQPRTSALAASIEGHITSAFGKGASAGEARVLVVASSRFLSNPFAEVKDDPALEQLATPYAQSQLTSMILVFKNTLDYLGSDDDLARCALPVKSE